MSSNRSTGIETRTTGLCLVNLAHLDPPRNGGLSRVAQHVSQLLLHGAQAGRRFIPIYVVNADFVDQFAGWIGSPDAITIPYNLYAPPLSLFSWLRPDWIISPLFGVKPIQLFPEFDGVPHIAMMPDTLALDRPEAFPKAGSKALREDYQLLRKADKVITLSEFSREHLLAHLRAQPKDVIAIGLGADALTEAGSATHGGAAPLYPYVFYPANSWPHKRHELLFRIMTRVWSRRPDIHLVLTGRHSPDLGVDIERLMRQTSAPADRVHDLQFVSDAELRDLYAHAEALLFVSSYEGFGMPVVEAMQNGCPVICAPVTSIPEIAGDAALYVDSDKPERWAGALLDELPARRGLLVERGLENARRFTWAHMRQQWAEVLVEQGLPLDDSPAGESEMASYVATDAALRQLIGPLTDQTGRGEVGLAQYVRYLFRRGLTSRSGKLPDVRKILRTMARLAAGKRIP